MEDIDDEGEDVDQRKSRKFACEGCPTERGMLNQNTVWAERYLDSKVDRDDEFSESEDEADEAERRRDRASYKRPRLEVPPAANGEKSQSPVPPVAPEQPSVALSEVVAAVSAQPSLAERATTTPTGNGEIEMQPSEPTTAATAPEAAPEAAVSAGEVVEEAAAAVSTVSTVSTGQQDAPAAAVEVTTTNVDVEMAEPYVTIEKREEEGANAPVRIIFVTAAANVCGR
jgi:hypothetical protein